MLSITLIHKKKVEVIAREWRQNFMLALGNLKITPPKKIKILWFNFYGRGPNASFTFKR